MKFTRSQIHSLLSRVVVIKGRREGLTLGPSSVKQYTASFMAVYRDIGEDIFVAGLLKEFLEETCPNLKTRRSSITAVNHIVKQAAGFSDEIKRDMQALCAKICDKCNSKDTIMASWIEKMPLLVKYRTIPYKELLLSLAAGAEQRSNGAEFVRLQASVAFALIAANEPLRTDYRNIVIADRCNPLPPKTPYYQDGKVYFPDGSRVKTGRGSPTLDVGESRGLIEEFISRHPTIYLLGNHMEANTFSHLLLDESERQTGDKLGIRFFRAKYGAEHRKRTRAAHKQCEVMDHSLSTDVTFYAPPVEFDGELEAPMNGEETNDVEMAAEALMEMAGSVADRMNLDFICN